jgi:hypothetical protein
MPGLLLRQGGSRAGCKGDSANSQFHVAPYAALYRNILNGIYGNILNGGFRSSWIWHKIFMVPNFGSSLAALGI